MSRKFFDIIPPDKNQKFFEENGGFDYAKEIEKEEFSKNLRLSESGLKKRQGFCQKGNLFLRVRRTLFFCLFFLVLAGIFSFFVFSTVKIKILPNTKVSHFKTKVIVKIGNNKSDFQRNILAGRIFENQKSASREFPATGSVIKERKAEGIIRVFNNYSTSAQRWRPNTRFVSDKGKLFLSTKWEVIPGGHYSKGKFIAGFTDIKVRAAKAGEEYNIGPSTFSIPAFKGTPKYTYFYGKSFSPMTGGFRGEVSQVTKKDIEKAELILSGELKKEGRDFLKKTVPADYILLEPTIFQSITESNSSVKAGAEANSFDLRVKVKSQGIGFKKSEMDKFIQDFLVSNIPENQTFRKDSLKVAYSLSSENGSPVDILKSGKVVLSVEIEASIYQKMDLGEIKKALSGKSFKEAKTFLEDLPYIAKVKIESWPIVLRRRISDDINKIELKLDFGLD